MGIAQDGSVTRRFVRGMALSDRYTLLGEGGRGSLAQSPSLTTASTKDGSLKKYGVGFKEVWQVRPEKFRAGRVQHTFGRPLDDRTAGGSLV
jgi:electron-transferring-flavoprotein dehydrogenase